MDCQATFKEHCQYPKCDCDRKPVTAAIINAPPDLNNRPMLKKYIEEQEKSAQRLLR